jgi:endonuclease/exonuclease/phosphatase family metal-dependent hydrolase
VSPVPEFGFPGSNRAMLQKILRNTEKIMADVTNLQAADTALKSEIATFIADWQAQLAAANGDQAAVDAVTADMQSTITQLQASDPAVTVTPPAPPAA